MTYAAIVDGRDRYECRHCHQVYQMPELFPHHSLGYIVEGHLSPLDDYLSLCEGSEKPINDADYVRVVHIQDFLYQCLNCEREFTLDDCYLYHFPLHRKQDSLMMCSYGGRKIFDPASCLIVIPAKEM